MHTVGSGTLPGGNGSSGQASQPGFNPFGLPAPTYNQAAPPSYADNTFADFSPLTPAPPPPAPQPMRYAPHYQSSVSKLANYHPGRGSLKPVTLPKAVEASLGLQERFAASIQ